MKPSEMFIEVVRASQDLPADVRSHAGEARGIEESSFDESYIQFLDEQIRLSPRGPEWTAILRRRREGLHSFCDVPLVSGHIRSGRFDTWIKIDPRKRAIVFWEQLEYGLPPNTPPQPARNNSLEWFALACKLLAIFVSVLIPMVLPPRWGVNPIADVQLVVLAILSLVPNRWLVFSTPSFLIFLLLALFPFHIYLPPSVYKGADIAEIAGGLLMAFFIFGPLPLSLIFSRIRLRRGDRFVYA